MSYAKVSESFSYKNFACKAEPNRVHVAIIVKLLLLLRPQTRKIAKNWIFTNEKVE